MRYNCVKQNNMIIDLFSGESIKKAEWFGISASSVFGSN